MARWLCVLCSLGMVACSSASKSPQSVAVSKPKIIVTAALEHVVSHADDAALLATREHALNLMPQIDSVVERAIAAHKMPGCVVVVGTHERVLFEKAYGQRALLPMREAMTLDTVFDLASLTKAVATAPMIMALVERGKLRLSDRVAEYLPAFAANRKQDITVRDLLLHVSGLPVENPLRDYDDGKQLAEARLLALKSSARSGAGYQYSDVGYLVLGLLIEKLTGDIEAFARSALFDPLEMHDTAYRLSVAQRQRAAPTELRDDQWIRGVAHDPRAYRIGGVAGNAGLFSTAHDLARFAQMLLSHGTLAQSRVLASASVAAMTAPHRIGAVIHTLGWDMRSERDGLRGDLLSPRAFGHGGFTGTSLWIDPEQDLFVLFLSNRVHPDGTGYVIRSIGEITNIAAAKARGATGDAACEHDRGHVLSGIDVVENHDFATLRGHRVAVLSNAGARDRRGARTVDVLRRAAGVQVVSLLTPEHGMNASAEGAVANATDTPSGLPTYSLFGKTRKPTVDMLHGADTIVFDLQDVGTRYFTYMSTLRLVLEAAASLHVRVVVLDRPNPIGGLIVDGPVLDGSASSFVNYHPLPARHGMTAGELAGLLNEDLKLGADLEVVTMNRWHRDFLFEDTGLTWYPPSPNLRFPSAVTLYPAVGLLESTNVSVGRGTERPFELVGAPWLDAAALVERLRADAITGVRISAVVFTPTSDRYRGEVCHGISLNVEDPRHFSAVRFALSLAAHIQALHPQEFEAALIGKMIGNRQVTDMLLRGASQDAMQAAWEPELHAFTEKRATHLLYTACP